jgi:hypothetical protein
MVFGSNNRLVPQDFWVDGASPSDHFSQHESQGFKRVPHFLDDDLRAKRLESSRWLFDILQAQERCHFRYLITENETWVYLDMKAWTI